MRAGKFAGAITLLVLLWSPKDAAAQEVSGVATAAIAKSGVHSKFEHRDGNRTIRVERDAQGRWRRVETTRIELIRIRRRSRLSLFRAPASASYTQLRTAGQKLANRERRTVGILFGGGTRVMAFAPKRALAAKK